MNMNQELVFNRKRHNKDGRHANPTLNNSQHFSQSNLVLGLELEESGNLILGFFLAPSLIEREVKLTSMEVSRQLVCIRAFKSFGSRN